MPRALQRPVAHAPFLKQELRSSMEHDALISTVQQDIFKGW
jgi:hypothetical protein